MGSGKYQLPCTKPVLAEHSNWAKIAVRYSVTMALCREHSSESLHQSLMEEGLVEGHSFVFIKYSPTFSTDYLYKMFMTGLMNRFDKPNKHCWRRQWHSTPVLLTGESHRWRSLVDYSPWVATSRTHTQQLNHHHQLLSNSYFLFRMLLWDV